MSGNIMIEFDGEPIYSFLFTSEKWPDNIIKISRYSRETFVLSLPADGRNGTMFQDNELKAFYFALKRLMISQGLLEEEWTVLPSAPIANQV